MKKNSIKQTFVTIFWAIKISFKYSPFHTIVIFISNIFSSLAPILSALLLGKLIDSAILAYNTNHTNIRDFVLRPLIFLILFKLVSTILAKMVAFSQRKIAYLVDWNLRIDLHHKLQSLGIQTLERPTINNEIQRARENLGRVSDTVSLTVLLIAGVISFIGTAIALAINFPIIIILYLIFLVPKYFLDKYYLGKLWKLEREDTEERRGAQEIIETLTNTKKLQELNITNSAHYLSDKYRNFVNNFITGRMDARKKWFSLSSLLEAGSDFVSYFGYYLTITRLIAREITIGQVTFYFRMINLFEETFIRISNFLTNIYELTIKLSEVKELFDLKSDNLDGEKELPLYKKGPNISVENLSFKYFNSDKYVIKNLNLEIKSGEKIAIVGHNGAGKTTLVKLLSNFYRPSEGSIKVNGTDLRDVNSKSWFKNIGVLFQDYNTYDFLTARENVMLGNPNIEFDEKRMINALKSGDALDFIKDFDNSFEQILSEKYKGGTRPSTGQWQKIAISRFFYRNAPLVIFDEPTASIDSVSEYKIFNKIYDFFKEKTVIIISHRFSTVRNADRIIVFDKGEMVEQGSHEELLELDGVYAHSFKLQAEGYK